MQRGDDAHDENLLPNCGPRKHPMSLPAHYELKTREAPLVAAADLACRLLLRVDMYSTTEQLLMLLFTITPAVFHCLVLKKLLDQTYN